SRRIETRQSQLMRGFGIEREEERAKQRIEHAWWQKSAGPKQGGRMITSPKNEHRIDRAPVLHVVTRGADVARERARRRRNLELRATRGSSRLHRRAGSRARVQRQGAWSIVRPSRISAEGDRADLAACRSPAEMVRVRAALSRPGSRRGG